MKKIIKNRFYIILALVIIVLVSFGSNLEFNSITQKVPPVTVDKPKAELKYLGDYETTYYCPCLLCCGKTDGITASGEKAVEGQTIACQPSIPFGTVLVLEDEQGKKKEYVCQDRGGAIQDKQLDIYMDSHNECLKNGVKKFKVYVKN